LRLFPRIAKSQPESQDKAAGAAPTAHLPDKPATAASPEPDKRRGLFAHLVRGLAKTRENFEKHLKQFVGRSHVDEKCFEELEMALLEADAGVTVTEQLLDRLQQQVREKKLGPEQLLPALSAEVLQLLSAAAAPFAYPEKGSLRVYLVTGVNGSGKTTTIGKLAHLYRREGRQVILAACDTFRAAAVDQLATWAERTGAQIISQKAGSDPAAVAFDALQAARARQAEALIIDTAGRLQTKVPLMQELAKINRVVTRELGRSPDEVLLVLDALTGQNALSQARLFKEAVPLTGIVLTKLDSTAKGGIVLAIASELGIPVKLVGVGEKAEDLVEFDAEAFTHALFHNS